MPPIEGITSVTEGRGAGTADDDLLSTFTISASLPFRTVLEANTVQTASPGSSIRTASPTAETPSRVLQNTSNRETPAELLAILLNMLAPAVMNFASQANTVDALRGVTSLNGSPSSENLTTTPMPLADAKQNREIIAVGAQVQTSLGESRIDTRRVMVQNGISPVVPTVTLAHLFPGATEGITDRMTDVNFHITGRTFPPIPPQAPVVSNLLPTLGGSGELVLEVPEPVGAVEVQIGLPSTQVGERPSIAGDRIALVAEMGTQLAFTAPIDSSTFMQQFHHLTSLLPSTTANSASGPFPSGLPDNTGSGATFANAGMNISGNSLVNDTTPWMLGLTDGTIPASGLSLTSKTTTSGVMSEQALDALKAHLHQLNQDGEAEFRLHLHPPDLGPLRVHVSMREGEIHGQLYVLDDTLRRLLQDQLPELRQRLEALGLNAGQWEIAPDPSGSQPDTLWSSWQQTEAPAQEISTLWDDPPDHSLASHGWSLSNRVRVDGVESNHVDVIV
jgi:hypothetical protein